MPLMEFFSLLDAFCVLASLRCGWFKHSWLTLTGCFSLLQERLNQHFTLCSRLDLPYLATQLFCADFKAAPSIVRISLCFFCTASPRPKWMQPPSNPALMRNPGWNVSRSFATACSLRSCCTIIPEPEGRRGILNVLWCQLVLKLFSADSVPERDVEAGLFSSCMWGPRCGVSPQGFSGIQTFLLCGTGYLGVLCPTCTL